MGLQRVGQNWATKHTPTHKYLTTNFVWKYVFISLGCIPGNEISGSYGNSQFNFLSTYPTAQRLQHFTLPPSLAWGFQLLCILVSICYCLSSSIAILVGVKWYLSGFYLQQGVFCVWFLLPEFVMSNISSGKCNI